jgi:hypothetical protein
MLRAAIAALLLSSAPAAADWRGFYTPTAPSFDVEAMKRDAADFAREMESAAPPPSAESRATIPGVPDLPALSDALPDARPAESDVAATPAPAADDPGAICVSEILAAERRHDIPGNLLLAIGLQEAGTTRDGRRTIWPWTINAGGNGRMFDDRAEAIAWTDRLIEAGVDLVDLGCMQVNLRWHGERFDGVEEMIDPRANVDYAARFLLSLKAEMGGWDAAAGAYHSRNLERGEAYLEALAGRIGPAREMAETWGPPSSPADDPAPDRPAQTATPRAVWSAGLGASVASGGGVYGIYSSESIRPVMPAFEDKD